MPPVSSLSNPPVFGLPTDSTFKIHLFKTLHAIRYQLHAIRRRDTLFSCFVFQNATAGSPFTFQIYSALYERAICQAGFC